MADAFTGGAVTNVKIDEVALDNFLNDPAGDVGRWVKTRGNRIQTAAKRQVGKKTRVLEESIYLVHTRGPYYQEITIGSDDKIALLHHEGSRPHAIEARGNGMLRFSSHGRQIYTHRVMHPGTKPNHYLSDNLYLAFT